MNNVRYELHGVSNYYYGIIQNDSIYSGTTGYQSFGSEVLVVIDVQIHARCLVCNGPDCNTNECLKSGFKFAANFKASWQCSGNIQSPPLNAADVIAWIISQGVNKLTGNGISIIPIASTEIDNVQMIENQLDISKIQIPNDICMSKLSFLGRHCYE